MITIKLVNTPIGLEIVNDKPSKPIRVHVSLNCSNLDQASMIYKDNRDKINDIVRQLTQIALLNKAMSISLPIKHIFNHGHHIFEYFLTMTFFSCKTVLSDEDLDYKQLSLVTNESLNKQVLGSKSEIENRAKEIMKIEQDNKKREKKESKAIMDLVNKMDPGFDIRWRINKSKVLIQLKLKKYQLTKTRGPRLFNHIAILKHMGRLNQELRKSIKVINILSKFKKKVRSILNIRRYKMIILAISKFKSIQTKVNKSKFFHKVMNPKSGQIIVGESIKFEHIRGKIIKAKLNGQAKDGDQLVYQSDSKGLRFARPDGTPIFFTKFKNYKTPKVSINGKPSVYNINISAIKYCASLTKGFRRAKKPINLNLRTKFTTKLLANINKAYDSYNQVGHCMMNIHNLCWRTFEVVYFVRDVLFDY